MANINARLFARARARISNPAAPVRAPSGSGRSSSTQDACAPTCVCGLLECVCRPRFFAGQLLTEQDLNRLDAYIRAKNRLHTLQLHGWGVVNGLSVRCDPCGTGVIVGTGYAISPCGEDIIVCGDTTVDICSLIKQCRTSDATCLPGTPGGAGCGDLVEDWVLAIRYAETPTKGVTALRMGSSCGCNSTGGTCSNGNGCGCGGSVAKTSSTAPSNAMTTTTTQKPRGASPECEPTAICETYSFDVYKVPNEAERENPLRLEGSVIDVFLCCLEPLVASIPTPPSDPRTENFEAITSPAVKAAWNLWCCRVRDALITHFSSGPQASCTIVESLGALVCPAPGAANFGTAMAQAWEELQPYLVQAFVSCLCSALLPPAPAGTSDDRVPLAVVSVRKRDCKVMSVCSWTPLRKLVLTVPTLEYWLGWIPVFAALREILGDFCCGDVSESVNEMLNPEMSSQAAADNQTLADLIQAAIDRGEVPIDATAVIDGVYGLNGGAANPWSNAERANPAPWAVVNELVIPVIKSFMPREGSGGDEGGGGPIDGTDSTARPAPGTEPIVITAPVMDTIARPAPVEDTAALRERIVALEAAVMELRSRS